MNKLRSKQGTKRVYLASLSSVSLFVFTAISLSWGKGFEPPAGSLDPSWREALVQATDQGLHFGKDLVFTFGPYHQLYTNTISSNLAPLIIGRLLYGLAWGATAVALAEISAPAFGWLFAIFMAVSGSVNDDAPFYALQMAFLLISTRVTKPRQWIWLALIYCGITTTVLCKLSFAVSAVSIIVSALIVLVRRRFLSLRQIPLICLILALLPIIIWHASGQEFNSLPIYFFGPNLSIILGYSSAMSLDDSSASWQILIYWIGASMIAITVYQATLDKFTNQKLSYLIVFSLFFLFWITFKASMVRHDGHATLAGQALACFAILSYLYAYSKGNSRGITILSLSAATLGLSITSQYFFPIRSRLGLWLNTRAQNTYLFSRLASSSNMREKLQALRRDGFARLLETSERLDLIPVNSQTDALPWDISDLLANGLQYTPRPVIQSYSSYKPNLQLLNKLHFESPKAPSYIVLKSMSIDKRIPPDYDYPSIQTIASLYQIVGEGSQKSLILKRLPSTRIYRKNYWKATRFPLAVRSKAGEDAIKAEAWQKLPKSLKPGSRFSIEVNQTIWRRLQSLVFKPTPLFIRIKFDDGQVITRRVLESTTREVPLYPFILNNQSLSSYIRAIQNQAEPLSAMAPKPVALKLKGSFYSHGLETATLVVEQPFSR